MSPTLIMSDNPSNVTMTATCKLDPISEPELPFSVYDGVLYPTLAQRTTRYDVLKTWVVCFLSAF